MFTFLRRIRKSLIASSSFRKYMLYAIGEIALVVIGILIALQINNWNEKRKDLNKAFSILREIQQNTVNNIGFMESDIKLEWRVIKSIDLLQNHLKSSKPYHDSLDYHFYLSFFLPGVEWRTTGFESLQSLGVDLLRSDSLRQAIVQLYQLDYSTIQELTRHSEGIQQTVNEPIITELFETYYKQEGQPIEDGIFWGAKPFNYDAACNSDKLKGALSKWKSYRYSSIRGKMWEIRKSEELVIHIEMELSKGRH